ncbi:MAG: hypothetical protein LBU25_04655 [Treponema sp.]|nr:hypothetical protein [Treponema sp.]
MEYELIREIINPCAGETRPDVSASEDETDAIDASVRRLFTGQERSLTKTENPCGSVIYEGITGELKPPLTFTP